MRPLLAFAILLVGLGNSAPEPEYAALVGRYFHKSQGGSAGLVEIESAAGRGDRLTVPELQPRVLAVEILKPQKFDPTLRFASATADIGPEAAASAVIDADFVTRTDTDTDRATDGSIDALCNMMFTSAQNNDLPVPFFANLLWQESRLRADDVSKKGAMGIAQFMPETAVENGLDDPFDPMEAIPASARLLRDLRLQFGNLGFVAAAYNAGAHRVAQWLEHRSNLPRETRNYVMRVTGLTADAWRKIPVDDAALTFARPLPCRSLPAFANFEQEQSEQAQLEQTKLVQEEAQLAATEREATEHSEDRRHGRQHARHEAARAVHEHRDGKREAEHHPRAGHEKHKSA
jgi:hypothetical protein